MKKGEREREGKERSWQTIGTKWNKKVKNKYIIHTINFWTNGIIIYIECKKYLFFIKNIHQYRSLSLLDEKLWKTINIISYYCYYLPT